MKIQTISIDKLNPAEYNPRLNLQKGDAAYDKLEKSIDKFGCVEPIVWNETTGNVVGGHQRLKVLIDRGISEIDVSVVNLSIEDEKVLNIALNKIMGDWDNEKLFDLLAELKFADVNISVTGFNDDEINKIIAEFTECDIIEDDFDIDNAMPEEPISRQGDVWTLGPHILICGDSTLKETYSTLMGSDVADLIITDPPYNVDYEGEAGKIKNDKMKDEDFFNFLLSSFSLVNHYMNDGASIYIFYADSESINFKKAFDVAGFHHSCTCIWIKNSFVMGRSDYHWQHEPIIYGWKKGAPHNWFADRTQSTVWEFDRPIKSELHPTMKPIALCAYPIVNSSKQGDIIFDPFGGSGSVLIACEQTGRICRMIEIDEKYCDVIVKRYIEQTDDIAYLTRDGETKQIKI